MSLRTDSPSNLTINYTESIDPSEEAYEVSIYGNHDNTNLGDVLNKIQLLSNQ